MPAVTAENILALDRIPEPDPVTTRSRPVVSVTTAPKGYEGEGFPVRRAFAGVDLRALDPFVHMDQMGEVDYGPGEPKGTAWNPHRGLETLTYIIDGTFQPQDSNGGGGAQEDPPALPGHPGRAGRAAVLGRRRGAAAGDRGIVRRPRRARDHAHA